MISEQVRKFPGISLALSAERDREKLLSDILDTAIELTNCDAGTLYPDHRMADDIPWEVRLLTILDVFDALTARDRPYKPPMPTEEALGILHSMVQEDSVDGEILTLFEQSKAWEPGA